MIASLGAQPGWRIVDDVGCGTGRLFEHLLAGAAQAIGVDRDAGMLDHAAVRAPGCLVRADAGRLPLADRSVDAAVAVIVLEFSTRPASVLAEMARVTRPGGRLVVGVPNPHSPWGWADQARRRPDERRAVRLAPDAPTAPARPAARRTTQARPTRSTPNAAQSKSSRVALRRHNDSVRFADRATASIAAWVDTSVS